MGVKPLVRIMVGIAFQPSDSHVFEKLELGDTSIVDAVTYFTDLRHRIPLRRGQLDIHHPPVGERRDQHFRT
jgi:hypothetical protein